MIDVGGDGVMWTLAGPLLAVWSDPASLETVLRGHLAADAVVSVWGSASAGAGRPGRCATTVRPDIRRRRLVVERLDPGPSEGGSGAPARFGVRRVGEEPDSLGRAALRLGSALEPRRSASPEPQRRPPTGPEVAPVRSRLGVAGPVGPGGLRVAAPRPTQLVAPLGGGVEHRGRIWHRALLLGPVRDDGWALAADRLPFPVAWCVRRVPARRLPAAGVVAVAAGEAEIHEARVHPVRAAFADEGRDLVRPVEQPARARAIGPWARLPRRLWHWAVRLAEGGRA